jgi:hypothetical protein
MLCQGSAATLSATAVAEAAPTMVCTSGVSDAADEDADAEAEVAGDR